MFVHAEKGDSFYTAVKKVKDNILKSTDYIDLEFNEIRVRVSKDSNIDDLAIIYDLKCKIRRMEAGYKD